MAGKRRRNGGPSIEVQRLAHMFNQLMVDRGETQASIAKTIEVHYTYVSKWITGEREGVGAEIIGRVCAAYDVDPMYFFEDYGDVRSYREYPRRNAEDRLSLSRRIAEVERHLQLDKTPELARQRSQKPQR